MNKIKEKIDNGISILAIIFTAFIIFILLLLGVIILIPFFIIGIIVIGFKKVKRIVHRSSKLIK